MLTKDRVVSLLNRMGLAASVVCLHSSYRAIGEVEGGPEALIEAFLEIGSTLLVPTFTYNAEIAPPPTCPYKQNGLDPRLVQVYGKQSFEPGSSSISPLMGAVPTALIAFEGMSRGFHPLNSFAAVGPLAALIIKQQRLLNVYGPYKYIYNNLDSSYIMLLGTDLTSCTPIHFAEELAGMALFRRWALLRGEVTEVEVGSCSQGFESLSPTLQGIEQRATLGNGQVRLFPFRKFIETVTSALRADPALAHCSNSACAQCADKAKGGVILPCNC